MEERKATREEFVRGLREMADFYEQHPEFPQPYGLESFGAYAGTKIKFQQLCRELGTFEKQGDGNHFRVVRWFGPGLQIYLFIDREQVCHKVKRLKTVEVEEWECPESVLAPTKGSKE